MVQHSYVKKRGLKTENKASYDVLLQSVNPNMTTFEMAVMGCLDFSNSLETGGYCSQVRYVVVESGIRNTIQVSETPSQLFKL